MTSPESISQNPSQSEKSSTTLVTLSLPKEAAERLMTIIEAGGLSSVPGLEEVIQIEIIHSQDK